MAFSGNSRPHAANAGDSVPGVPLSPPDDGSAPTASEVAYVFADAHGSCTDATAGALELLGTDRETLRMLRVGDLSKSESPDSLTRQLVASCEEVGRWFDGRCELLRADGAIVRVHFGAIRLKTGELVARFEPLTESSNDGGPRQVLEAWRQQELALVHATPGTIQHRLAELEALWLAAEYQRLAIARAESIETDQ